MAKVEQTINQVQAAACLGVTTRRLRQMDSEEIPPPRNADGKYPCKQYGEWLREGLQRGLHINADGTAYDFSVERARLTHHQANIAALEEEAKRRGLIPAEVAVLHWQEIRSAADPVLASLPVKIALACSGKFGAELEREARRVVYETLEELGRQGVTE
jgi:phage terminase Nu1 subunit (DNA packaging protein)